MAERLPNIHILGIQGSGKGTQSSLLVDRYNLTYIASGNLFRERAQIDDEFGRDIQARMKTGKLFPDEYLLAAVEFALSRSVLTVGLLGDGVIRKIEQYHKLLPLWERHNLEVPLLIHLSLTEEVALSRIEQRRKEAQDAEKRDYHLQYSGKLLHRRVDDENPEAVRARFAHFHEMTAPVVELMEDLGRCIHIDANQPIEKIHEEIRTNLEQWYPVLTHGTH